MTKLYPYKEETHLMDRIGWIATMLALLTIAAVVALLVASLPELKRYLKMEMM